MRWFGREPALWLALLQSVLAIVVGFGVDGLSAEQAALWMTAFNALLGVVVALRTRPIGPTAFTHLVTVVVTLLAAYQLDLSQELVAGVNLLVLNILMLITRGEISPAEDAHKTGVLGDKVTTGVNTGKTY